MLQDVEHGRAIEIDALLGSVIELARMANVATPHLDAIYAATKLLGETVGDAEGGWIAPPNGSAQGSQLSDMT